MPKNLQNLIMLFEFVAKNAKIMFVYYLFRKCQFTLANGCPNLNEWFDPVLLWQLNSK